MYDMAVKSRMFQLAYGMVFLKLTPSLPQPVNFLGRKVHAHMPVDGMLDGPITNLLSVLSILMEILSCTHVKGKKSLMFSDLARLLVVFQLMAQQAWQ